MRSYRRYGVKALRRLDLGMEHGLGRNASTPPRSRTAFTLIELLVTALIVGILTVAMASAFAYGVSYQSKSEDSRQRELARIQFEDKIRSLLANTTVTTDPTDSTNYFLAGADATGDDSRITFTTQIPYIAGAAVDSQDDFETQNQEFGPQGGLEEVSIGMTPVGQPSQNTGIFLREQRPADGDPSQGGYESDLDPNVTSIEWEFFDGTNWQTTWDTAQTTRRIPAAVRVTYQLQDEQDPRVFVVRLKNSDVTPANPVVQTSTTPGATG